LPKTINQDKIERAKKPDGTHLLDSQEYAKPSEKKGAEQPS
jgi:hypothetical protein